MELVLKNLKGEIVGKEQVPSIFFEPVSKGAIYYAVKAYLSNQRQGTASTKCRGEVRGGGRKPWRQKHTGRARAGSIRSPLWRGGGVVFGPKPHSFRENIPKKVKKVALRSAITIKLQKKQLYLVDSLDIPQVKTKTLAKIISTLSLKKPLFVVEKPNETLRLSLRNITNAKYALSALLNCYEVLNSKELLLTPQALADLANRCQINKDRYGEDISS